MATQATSSSPSSTSSSSSCPRWKYDVFLSFCGVDSRINFTDHLYTALKQKGIITFRDDEKLERGKYISIELLKAIEESKYAIIVLSTNYAFSKWCLIELAKIVECMKKTKLTVLPVFYHMDPSDVRNQRGSVAEAFAEHEKDTKINTEDVQAWKATLKDVGFISGWHVHDRHESIVIQEILERISSELNLVFQSTISNELVGIESRVREMLDLYLDKGSDVVHFVGVCGMGGIGKTTLALSIYERISSKFEASSFIADVREKTKNQHLVSLQEQLLSNILMEREIKLGNVHEGIKIIGNRLRGKKVLIVLDDVDEEKQINALVGNHNWFGPGSRIIITSRNDHLLRRCVVDYICTAKELNDNEALRLFSLSAFKNLHPKENYVDLSMYFVNYTKGLPLALKTLGSLLFNKSIDEWKDAIHELKACKEILDVLQISFDGLTDMQKELFLDIACFFKQKNKDCIRDILKSFGYNPDYNIGVLTDMSLITINKNGDLCMHDLLQEMGRQIVFRESPNEPGGRSRLWHCEDVLHTLKNNIGTVAVKGIELNTPNQKEESLSAEAFTKMTKLRFLKICNVQLPKDLSFLSNELRFIEWYRYPLKSMPTSFQPNKLVELRMHCSSLKHLWKGIMNLDELRLIDLSDSQNLIEMSDLSGAPKLKQLILQRCIRLYKIHASLGDHKQLIQLDLNGCKSLESLPHKINSEVLEIFNLGGCSRLKKLPEFVGNMSRLSELCLSETVIKDLPLLAEHLTGLTKLDLRDCKNLSSLPNIVCCLMSLKILTLSGCSKINELPEKLGNIKGLEKLDVSGTAITELPSSIVFLKNLKVLSLCRCEGLSSMPSNKLFSFTLMRKRRVDPTGMLERSLSNLWSLTELNLSYCNLPAIPDSLGCLHSLTHLDLRGNAFVGLPKSTTGLSNLNSLLLSGCTHLRSLPELPLNTQFIYADGCTSLVTFPLRPDANFNPFIHLVNCIKLIDNQDYLDICLAMLRNYFQSQRKRGHLFAIPGREIPKWFTHQSVGASMNLQVPSNLCNKLMGVTVCAIFVLRQHRPFPQLNSLFNWRSYRATHRLWCSLISDRFRFGNDGSFCFSEEFGEVESYHLYQNYHPIVQSFNEERKEKLSQADVDIFRQIEIKFKTRGPGLEVMKCGGRLIFEQDIEDLNQTMPRCSNSSSCSITPYEDDFEGLAEDTQTKRSRDDFDGTSEEGTSNEVDVPRPKRIQLPNLIERFIPRLGNWIENLSTQGQGNTDCEKEESQ